MFVERIESPGLAHLSWLVGDGGEAAVIDPRRDCAVYLERAAARKCRIIRIFETHRNEDLVSGASALAARSRAPVHHGPRADGTVTYAATVREGDVFRLGRARLVVLETPGHTDDSLSFALYHDGDAAIGVFTGDALFHGDVGRTDFYPHRAAEVAGLLYDSLQKLLALGNQAVVWPAHGAGSICGGRIADRETSTLGLERRSNPMLRIDDRDAFIRTKLAEHHYQPPYFRLMERLNLTGVAAPPEPVVPPALTAAAFEAAGATVVDVRGVAAFLGAHVPDSLCLPVGMVPAFAGWLLDPDEPLVLVADDGGQAATATRHLARIGYDRVAGFLAPAITGWAESGRPFRRLPAIDTTEVARRLAGRGNDWTLLDVRGLPEVEAAPMPGATHIYVGELAARLATLDPARPTTTMCASGARAAIAASLLLRAGFRTVDVYLGSMGAWQASRGRD